MQITIPINSLNKMNRTFWYLIALLLSFCVDSFGFTKYVTHNLNLRYEPNAHSYVLTVIPKGTAVTIEEDCKCLWVPVEYNGYVGFVSTKYLSKNPVSHHFKSNISKRSKYKRFLFHLIRLSIFIFIFFLFSYLFKCDVLFIIKHVQRHNKRKEKFIFLFRR